MNRTPLAVVLLFASGVCAYGARGPAARASATPGAGAEAAEGRAGRRLPPEKAEPVRLPRFGQAPVIDGRLDDAAWSGAAVLKDFYQTHPGDNAPPSKPTEVRLGFDSKFLYVAFRAFDEPDKVRATLPKRDAVEADDHVRLILDTFNDERRAYLLFFNPHGVQQDGVYTEDRGPDFSVDLVMESKGLIAPDGYTVEVAVPFKSLRYEAGRGRLWGVHAQRKIKRFNDETDSWMPHRRDQAGWLNQAGRVTGLEGISAERTLELIPSLTVSETGRRTRTLPRALVENNPALRDPGRIVNAPVALEAGLTAKLGLTPTVTLDFAYNPDFAQVEADATVVTANQRFPSSSRRSARSSSKAKKSSRRCSTSSTRAPSLTPTTP
ncbi:MAG TPA: carbohydrate binding family 9 domain-containing protein [Pyrinomonadaceae bacterium]|nr:carbohydrate binding family 9 domain-containing protein [Pyrinomonadaceae bacterium]